MYQDNLDCLITKQFENCKVTEIDGNLDRFLEYGGYYLVDVVSTRGTKFSFIFAVMQFKPPYRVEIVV